MMTKQQTTRILCDTGTVFHTLSQDADGNFVSTGCPDAAKHADTFAALVRLGRHPQRVSHCTAFIALLKYGLPALIADEMVHSSARGIGPQAKNAWDEVYVRFEGSMLVKLERERLVHEAEKAVSAENELAFQALRKASYRPYFDVSELRDQTAFHRPDKIQGGTEVALFREDDWNVPLQHDWTHNVHAAGIAVVRGKFVVGVDLDNPGFVYAIDKSDESERYTVQRFALVNGLLVAA